MMMMMTQTVKQSRCCSEMLDSAASCVHGQSKMVDDLLGWTSETLSVLTTNFNAVLTNDLKLADSQMKQHIVSAYLSLSQCLCLSLDLSVSLSLSVSLVGWVAQW